MADSEYQLDVLPAQETDVDRLMDIQFSAFQNDQYHEAVYPGNHYSPAVRRSAGERTITEWREDPNAHFMKCVDRDSDLILGFAKWDIYLTQRAPKEYKQRPVVHWARGRQKEVAENFLRATCAMREKIWEGRPHALLAFLAVHKGHQRRGAGKALVQWGVEQSKKLSLPAYLEASKQGLYLYRHLGFHQIDVVIVKARDWDGDVDQEYAVMLKENS